MKEVQGVAMFKGVRNWTIYKAELSGQTWLKEKAERITFARFERLKEWFCIPEDAVWIADDDVDLYEQMTKQSELD